MHIGISHACCWRANRPSTNVLNLVAGCSDPVPNGDMGSSRECCFTGLDQWWSSMLVLQLVRRETSSLRYIYASTLTLDQHHLIPREHLTRPFASRALQLLPNSRRPVPLGSRSGTATSKSDSIVVHRLDIHRRPDLVDRLGRVRGRLPIASTDHGQQPGVRGPEVAEHAVLLGYTGVLAGGQRMGLPPVVGYQPRCWCASRRRLRCRRLRVGGNVFPEAYG